MRAVIAGRRTPWLLLALAALGAILLGNGTASAAGVIKVARASTPTTTVISGQIIHDLKLTGAGTTCTVQGKFEVQGARLIVDAGVTLAFENDLNNVPGSLVLEVLNGKAGTLDASKGTRAA